VALVFIGGAAFGAFNVDRYVFLFVALGLGLLLAPFLWAALAKAMGRVSFPDRDCRNLYFSASALLCLMLGCLIPAQVLSSSVSDFEAPWGFMARTFIQSVAFALLMPLLVWRFSNAMVKKIFAFALAIVTLSSMICLFALSSSYGAMTNSFKIEDTRLIYNAFPFWVNIIAMLVSIGIPCIFIFFGKQKILSSIFNATALAILVLAIVNMASINAEIRQLKKIGWGDPANNMHAQEGNEAVFSLTRSGTNNFIIFIDKAIGIGMHTALKEIPVLAEQFDGFIWYPNTLSLGSVTITGLPGMLGGYDYIPQKINERPDVLLKDKINESITMLPKLFGESGFRVSITDPTMANMQFVPDLSVFEKLKNVKARNIEGRLAARFRKEFPGEDENETNSFNFDILFRYGVFRIALPILRYGIYHNGKWWREGASNAYEIGIAQFSSLYYLSDLCAVDDREDTLNIFMNGTTHESGAFTADLLPHQGIIRYNQEEIAKFGSADNAAYMYTYMATMNALGRWLESLKEMQVYDNTRIIIVADHGGGIRSKYFEPTGMDRYNPLLMVKNPNNRGKLKISDEFMTNADVPALVTKEMNSPVNPYLNTPITSLPKNDILIAVQEVSSQPRRHGPYGYNLTKIRKFSGKDIFNPDSWSEWERVVK
jgi:hypothetical protein